MTLRVLISGGSGFVGQAVCAEALRQGFLVRGALRKVGSLPEGVEPTVVGEINGTTDWSVALQGVDVVIHLAARVHVMKDASVDPLAEFRRVNVLGTENLVRQAAQAGVKRLVYVSSIKVNGEETASCQRAGYSNFLSANRAERVTFSEVDGADPQDPYGVSKWEAEQVLQRFAQNSALEVAIVRPPLVYGPGVKGNFLSLFAAVDRGIPLPLAGADNARNLIYVGNLANALIACATNPAAAGQTYLVSDGMPISTAELVKKIARALGRCDRSFYFPPALVCAGAALLGRSAQVARLFKSLRISDEKIRNELHWTPPYTFEQGLSATAEWYAATLMVKDQK